MDMDILLGKGGMTSLMPKLPFLSEYFFLWNVYLYPLKCPCLSQLLWRGISLFTPIPSPAGYGHGCSQSINLEYDVFFYGFD